MTVSIKDVESRIDLWFRELEPICRHKNPWIFLCLSALIEYLTRLANGKKTGRDEYKKFVKDFFPTSYRDFEYRNGKKDLPLQMYSVLRCGIVHSFSLVPTDTSRDARARSIVLEHREDAEKKGRKHLDNYHNHRANDAALFVAEAFMADTKSAAHELIRRASTDPSLKNNILTWFSDHPPITGEPDI